LESQFWAIGVTLALQSIGAIWWAANLSSDIKYMKKKFDEIERDLDRAYSGRDGNRLESRVEKLELAYFGDRN